ASLSLPICVNQLLRGLIFIILVFLVTSDLKDFFSALATSSSLGAFLRQSTSAAQQQTSSSHHQDRVRRHAAGQGRHREGGEVDEGAGTHSDHSDFNDNDALDPVKRLNNRGQSAYAKRKAMKLTAEEKKELLAMKTQLTAVMQEWCLPKLVCELHASVSERGSLTEAEKGLLSLIRETSLGTMGEVVSRYHFAAHMGQLISGVEGNGCHNFYPNCPLSGNRVLQMMKKVRIR
ncbi:hypothetical protein Ocin01_09616, partial [Orchesella cincta]